MEAKDNLKPLRVVDRTMERLALTKQGAAIYKFSKKNGKNCGPLQENEERDRNLYDSLHRPTE
jgi:hypothetical protein